MISIRPDAYYVSVLDIDARDLVARGYRAVLLDLDSTLQPRVPPAFRPRWSPGSNRSKDAGLSVALISNSARERPVEAARVLDVYLVRNAMKPFARGYVRMRRSGRSL